jgi:hypothetical protein
MNPFVISVRGNNNIININMFRGVYNASPQDRFYRNAFIPSYNYNTGIRQLPSVGRAWWTNQYNNPYAYNNNRFGYGQLSYYYQPNFMENFGQPGFFV